MVVAATISWREEEGSVLETMATPGILKTKHSNVRWCRFHPEKIDCRKIRDML